MSTKLEDIDRQIFEKEWTPAFVFVSILSVIGTIGNIVALLGLYKKCTWLSFKGYIEFPFVVVFIANLVTCIVCVPLEVVQIRYTLTYPFVSLCKLTRYITHFFSLVVATLLVANSLIVRTINIKYGKQRLTWKFEKRFTAIMTLICAVISVPVIFVYDVVEHKIEICGTILIGYGCRGIQAGSSIMVKIYAALLIAIVSLGYVVILFAYIQVIRLKHCFQKDLKTTIREFVDTELVTSSLELVNRSESTVYAEWEEFLTLYRQLKKKYKNTKNTLATMKMTLIAAGFSFTGFCLYISSSIIDNQAIHLVDFGVISSLLPRCYLLQSAIHPIVFLLFNLKMRKRCTKACRNYIRK